MNNLNVRNTIKNIIIGVGISLIATIIFLIIYAILLTYTKISEDSIKPVIMIITGVSIFIGSSIANIKIKKRGLLNGGLIGGFYILVIYFISSLLNWDYSLNMQSLEMIGVAVVLGIFGGIVGVNK